LHRHCDNRSAGISTRLTSLRLSQTINDDVFPIVADKLCTGITQFLSHPGHIALDAGFALTISFWDFIALTALPWHVPTRFRSSSNVSIAFIRYFQLFPFVAFHRFFGLDPG
jgi:hypothetical protein